MIMAIISLFYLNALWQGIVQKDMAGACLGAHLKELLYNSLNINPLSFV